MPRASLESAFEEPANFRLNKISDVERGVAKDQKRCSWAVVLLAAVAAIAACIAAAPVIANLFVAMR
jgi:hypothetical protein